MLTRRDADGPHMRLNAQFEAAAISALRLLRGRGHARAAEPSGPTDPPSSGVEPVARSLRSTLGFARRHALAVRVVLALSASLGFLLFASEFFFTRVASRELIQQDARGYVADASALQTAFQEGSSPADA